MPAASPSREACVVHLPGSLFGRRVPVRRRGGYRETSKQSEADSDDCHVCRRRGMFGHCTAESSGSRSSEKVPADTHERACIREMLRPHLPTHILSDGDTATTFSFGVVGKMSATDPFFSHGLEHDCALFTWGKARARSSHANRHEHNTGRSNGDAGRGRGMAEEVPTRDGELGRHTYGEEEEKSVRASDP